MIKRYKSLDSTNTKLMELVRETTDYEALYGTAIIADTQTAGRGRHGRSFFSPPGCGVYVSVFLPSNPLMTVLAGLIVCEAIEELCGKAPKVKWVNDVFLNGKKICGILAEGVMKNGCLKGMVVGIGINLIECPVPDGLEGVIGAVYGMGEKPAITTVRLAEEVLRRLSDHRYDQKEIIAKYKSRLFILGKTVRVEKPEGSYEAIALDIDEMGHLIVEDSAGEVKVLTAGEVSIRPTGLTHSSGYGE